MVDGTGLSTPPLSRLTPPPDALLPALASKLAGVRWVEVGPGTAGQISAPRPTTPRWATRLSPPAVSGAPPSGSSSMLRLQVPLPDRYTRATSDQLDGWIAAAKAELGDRLLVLGH